MAQLQPVIGALSREASLASLSRVIRQGIEHLDDEVLAGTVVGTAAGGSRPTTHGDAGTGSPVLDPLPEDGWVDHDDPRVSDIFAEWQPEGSGRQP